jgi:acyl carrier protein
MARTTYRHALRQGLRAALLSDPRVILMGEDVGRFGGSYAVSQGLLDEFGEDRVRDTPLSESGFVGCGIGAAIGGLRPIVEIMTVNFSLLALDQIVDNAAALRHMSGGQVGVPLVIRMTTGAGRQLAAQHSHSFEAWYAHVPGLRVLAPATLEDARGMLLAADAHPLGRTRHRHRVRRDLDALTEETLRRDLAQCLGQIAPELDFATLDPHRSLRDQADLDSFDFLRLLLALQERVGAEVPEADYRQVDSIDGLIGYVRRHAPSQPVKSTEQDDQ